MRHLDDEALSALARREPDAVTYFREHLATACEACEGYLATHSGPDLLDGRVDAVLLALSPPRPQAPLDEVGLARVKKQLRAPPRWDARRLAEVDVDVLLAVNDRRSIALRARLCGFTISKGSVSAREIAEQMGVGKSAVTMRLERFRGRIKRELLRRVLAGRWE
ncbi:hypothetical protein MFUL124B02_29640 [Myxococcus fulvus 124B02]|nr:hypothetical protein MFUL124B02_29640 [Myxococcus fulvus 124B02]